MTKTYHVSTEAGWTSIQSESTPDGRLAHVEQPTCANWSCMAEASMDNTQDIAEIISSAIDTFFGEVDPTDFESDDLAYAIIRIAREAGVHISLK